MLAAALIYAVAPNVDEPFRFITPGAILAMLMWIIASVDFSLYVSNFANYNATSGSLGGAVVILFCFFVTAAVLLLGAEVNAELHQAKLGPPSPQDGTASDPEAKE